MPGREAKENRGGKIQYTGGDSEVRQITSAKSVNINRMTEQLGGLNWLVAMGKGGILYLTKAVPPCKNWEQCFEKLFEFIPRSIDR